MNSLELVEAFVNTAELEEGRDDLREPSGLAHWLAEHGLAPARVRASERQAADARAVREALRELLRANNGIEVDRARASAVLDDAARRAGLEVRFDAGSISLVPRERGAAGGIALVLAAAGSAMADGSWQKLKACRADDCRWAFVDHARNRSRQWCSMSVCGNRAKARNFRARHA
jgi:predicted RNA-binding Zn ribbon-like protein